MGAMMTTAAVGRSMEERGHFYSTYGWHPMSVAAALATLRPLRQGRRGFLKHVNALSALFATQLAVIRFRQTPQIRIRGLAIAVDFASEREAARIVKRAAELGLLLTSQDTTILLLPPLTISKSLATEGLSMLRTCG
jgi:acetylornithine/succinyldiaminopimelate/putrescine aminotransferase